MISAEEFLRGKGIDPQGRAPATSASASDVPAQGSPQGGAQCGVQDAAQPGGGTLKTRGSFGSTATREWSPRSRRKNRNTAGNRRRGGVSSWRGRRGRMPEGVSSGDGIPDAALDSERCQEAALTLLDSSARSVHDMRERLAGKGYDPSTVDGVVANLVRAGLLDDEAYARGLVEHCLGRLLGARGTLRELLRKGVPRDMARDAVLSADEAGRFADAADELAQKTARRARGLDRETRLRRFWSAGGRKGHSPQDLRAAADRYLMDDSAD